MDNDTFEADYDNVCTVCGNTPTVVALMPDKEKTEFDLCGPCCFGTARALDVEWWNADNKNTR